MLWSRQHSACCMLRQTRPLPVCFLGHEQREQLYQRAVVYTCSMRPTLASAAGIISGCTACMHAGQQALCTSRCQSPHPVVSTACHGDVPHFICHLCWSVTEQHLPVNAQQTTVWHHIPSSYTQKSLCKHQLVLVATWYAS